MGAMVPYFARRIVEFAEERQQWHSRGKGPAYSEVSLEDVSAGLKSFYSDTALNGAQDSLVCGIAHFGVGHVLFGTDFPFGPDKGERWPRLALESVSGLEIGQGDREAILSGNAARLLYGT